MTLVIIIGIFLALFALALVTKRRFGVLGLGLAAGAVLAQNWSREVGQVLEAQQIPVEPLSYWVAATIALIITPPLLLLIAGPVYTDRKYALAGAVCFALLGTLLLMGPITSDLPIIDGDVKSVFDFIASWQNLLIAGGLALAIIDMLLANGSKHHSKKSDKH